MYTPNWSCKYSQTSTVHSASLIESMLRIFSNSSFNGWENWGQIRGPGTRETQHVVDSDLIIFHIIWLKINMTIHRIYWASKKYQTQRKQWYKLRCTISPWIHSLFLPQWKNCYLGTSSLQFPAYLQWRVVLPLSSASGMLAAAAPSPFPSFLYVECWYDNGSWSSHSGPCDQSWVLKGANQGGRSLGLGQLWCHHTSLELATWTFLFFGPLLFWVSLP